MTLNELKYLHNQYVETEDNMMQVITDWGLTSKDKMNKNDVLIKKSVALRAKIEYYNKLFVCTLENFENELTNLFNREHVDFSFSWLEEKKNGKPYISYIVTFPEKYVADIVLLTKEKGETDDKQTKFDFTNLLFTHAMTYRDIIYEALFNIAVNNVKNYKELQNNKKSLLEIKTFLLNNKDNKQTRTIKNTNSQIIRIDNKINEIENYETFQQLKDVVKGLEI